MTDTTVTRSSSRAGDVSWGYIECPTDPSAYIYTYSITKPVPAGSDGGQEQPTGSSETPEKTD